jgi:hypothetical protein
MYAYADRDLLAETPVYNFAPFRGRAFLEAFAESRDAWTAACRPDEPPRDPLLAHLDRLRQSGVRATAGHCRAALADVDRSAPFSLDEYLRGLLFAVPPTLDAACASGFPLLVQRFEVTKRLWQRVDAQFRKAPPFAPAGVGQYALFSLCGTWTYRATGHLSFLNAALKADDIICSQPPGSLRPLEAALAVRAVNAELESVRDLARSAGVAWP